MEIIMRCVKYLGVAFAGALLFGALYQWYSERTEKSQIPGELISVAGHQFHLFCKGQGSPLVMLENGLWGSYPDWLYIIEGISQTTKVCAYDRLGLGWSSNNDKPTRAKDVVRYLHDLRRAASLDGPMVLVGFSAGGLYVREYYKEFSEDVQGMLLIDSSHEQQARRIEHISKDLSLEKFCSAVAWTGVGRIFGLFDKYPEKSFTQEQHEEQLRVYNRTGFCSGLVKQSQGFEQDLFSYTTPANLGDLPLTVIRAGKPIREQILIDSVPDSFLDEHESVWPQLQEELASLSTQSNLIVAVGSGHAVQLEQPELVIEALKSLIQKLRSI
jgi:pimeloyl-ACP methyl ester carboxylesterase